MKSTTKFVIIFSCSTFLLQLLYVMLYQTSGKRRLRKTNETLPTQTIKELSLQYIYKKIRENAGNTSTRQSQSKSVATRRNIIILSPGRGGSSFLGGIFDSSPSVMYWFEPLHTVITDQFDVDYELFFEGKEPRNYSETSIRVINSLLDCDFSNMRDSTLSAFSRSMFRRRSKALTTGYLLCPKKCVPFSKSLLSKACNSYDHTVIKILIDRVPNKTIESLEALFKQPDRYDLKVVHLVRDPRAVVHSMVYSAQWMKDHLDPTFRGNVYRICNPMLTNLRFGLSSPPSWLKNRFKVIRYEDLVLNTIELARELYRFAEFDWSMSVDEWINRHKSGASRTAAKNPYSLHRNASAVVDKWKNAPEAFIRTVEDVCGDLMNLVGYKMWTKQDRQMQ